MNIAEIEILYSDKQLIIVNKPAGLLSVPGVGPDKRDCVVTRLQPHYPTLRIVHRLDCATSGLMVLALDAQTHRELSRQFHDREVEKTYLAVVDGLLENDQGSVCEPLICDWPNRPRQIVHVSGKPALTHYLCRSRLLDRSRVELSPHTGRSHQLRVHMQFIGHPILGDTLYAPESARAASSRLLLHATALTFHHPETQQCMEFVSDAPF